MINFLFPGAAARLAVIRMRRLQSSWLLLVLLFCLALPGSAAAHPHVWVDYAVTAVFSPKGLDGFRVVWTFDEMFSAQILEVAGFKGGTASAAQVRKIREAAFDNLRNHQYFSHLWIDDKDFPVRAVQDFTARTNGHRLVYEFFIPCVVPVGAAPRTVGFLNLDRENFAEYTPERQQPLRIVNPAGLSVETQAPTPARPLQIRFRAKS